MRRLKQGAVIVVAVFVVAQLIRPTRTNPPTDATRTIQAHMGTARTLGPVLNRACGDCHSNATVWPWYTQVAPLSWLMAYTVKEGRKVVNFSEWAAYAPDQQRTLLERSCRAVSSGKMPGGAWTWLHPDAQLSTGDVEAICAAAQPETHTAGGH